MLPRQYLLALINETAATQRHNAGEVFIKGRPWKFNSNGDVTYGDEVTLLDVTDTDWTDGKAFSGTQQDNNTNQYVGIHCYFEATPSGSANGSIDAYLLYSTDGGTTYPINGSGIPVGSLSWSTQTDKRTMNFEL